MEKRMARQNYFIRMQRVLAYIDAHLDEDIDLDRLASVAAFSKFHFHRQFRALFGISALRYVHLMRMRKAAFQLAFRDRLDITEIGLDCGYETLEGFSRAFKAFHGATPSGFRTRPDWQPWHSTTQILSDAWSQTMENSNYQVEIIDMEPTGLLCMTHRGDPAKIGDTIRRFIAWRKANGLTPDRSRTFNIFPNDPATTAPDAFTMKICVAGNFRNAERHWNGDALEESALPAGRFARLTIRGNDTAFSAAADYLYREWLPSSGLEAADFPFFCERVRFFPDVSAHEAETHLFLHLA